MIFDFADRCTFLYRFSSSGSARLICSYINIKNYIGRLTAEIKSEKYIEQDAVWLDARDVIILQEGKNTIPNFTVSQQKLEAVRKKKMHYNMDDVEISRL